MPRFTAMMVAALKISGTAALGLLTGAHLTFSLSTLQNISSSAISTHLSHLKTRVSLPLSLYSTSALILTYLLSPPRSRHPYLLMAAIMPIIGFGVDVGIIKKHQQTQIQQSNNAAQKSKKSKISKMETATSEDEFEEITRSAVLNKPTFRADNEDDSTEEVGERDVKNKEAYQFAGLLNAGMTGLGFLIGLVGNWGEGRMSGYSYY